MKRRQFITLLAGAAAVISGGRIASPLRADMIFGKDNSTW
jgi:hypothetical protein